MQNKQLEFRGGVTAEDKHLEINKLQLDIILREKRKIAIIDPGALKILDVYLCKKYINLDIPSLNIIWIPVLITQCMFVN